MSDNNQKENNKVSIKPFIILFVLSIIIFSILYFCHSKKIENRFDKTLQNYEKSMSDIFNNIITNGVNENIYTNSFQTNSKIVINNNQLQNYSIEKLKLSFEVGFKMLESSMNEIMKNSNDILQFWFAFLSIIMIVFTLAGALINNNILSQAKEQLEIIKKEAKEETNKLIEENNKSIRITNLFNLSNQTYNTKDYNLSIKYLTEIIKIYEDDFNNKKYDEKSDSYDKAIKNCLIAYNIRGSAKDELKLYKEAMEDYNKAIKLNPNFSEVYNNIGISKYNLANTKEKNSEEYNELMKEAIEDYNKAIELNPNLSEAYNNRGNAKKKLQKIEEAIEDYNKAIELNPNYSMAYGNRGIIKHNLGNINEAMHDYNKAIELNPNFSEAYNNRGLAKYDLENIDEAIKDYNEAIRLNPNYSKAFYNRGLSKYYLANSKKENKEEYNKIINKAIEDYNRAIELNSNYSKAYYNRGNAKIKLQKVEEAIKDYDSAIELNSNYLKAYNNRGVAKLKLGKTEEAIKDFIKVYDFDNNNELKEFSKNQLISLAQEEHIEAIEFCNKHNIEFNDNKE